MKNVLFRVDADKNIGLGHYKRCVAISNYLSNSINRIFLTKSEEVIRLNENILTIKISSDYDFDQEISFTDKIINEYDIDVIISDINNHSASKNKSHYISYLKQLSVFNPLLVTFEDFIINQTNSNFIVIPYVGAENIKIDNVKKSNYLLGPKYFVIRKEFFALIPRVINNQTRSILISMGGSDVNNLTEKIVKIILSISENIHINIIKGSINNYKYNKIRELLKNSDNSFKIYESPGNMAEIMGKSDLGIFSSGLTQYEASAVGLPAIVISLNDYHKQVVDEYAKMNSIISFGTFGSNRIGKLKETIINIISNQQIRRDMSRNGKKIIDGKGIERIVNEIDSRLVS